MEFEIKDGLKVGETTFYDVTIGKVTTHILQQAKEAAEKVIPTPTGYELVVSPTRLENEMLRRRILKVGNINGPLQPKELSAITDGDMDIILKHMQELDAAEDMDSTGRLDKEPAGD